ncbi:choice-of-anchor I family protein [Novosphingobium album (ex Liu et al. 2023)]|uniref:Choice-of-anchor I family protein n=1 Tax=Novosphingobium album (ex Liu et al. 2023) TaxID=3031130 RepID=A0ABT5WQ13_9SPHN|nr:choice-of-anchor I family protein [Novosphingobium album (ex Liu et al. 2023)]MDE8652113.1 choice-of-anchor I family protein [Novosphingobium album (ex Liu et al. 2023)]
MLSEVGDIAFIGYNADGDDNLAFVTFKNITAGEVIYFTDNEWNGTSWADLNESAWSWTATADIAAGTVITIDNIGSGTAASNYGDVVIPIAGSGSNRGLSASGEMVYAYLGTATTPTVFLSAISNDGASSGALTGTGLAYGVNAVDLATIDGGADIGAYVGPRGGEADFAAYRALINDTANWITQDGSGDQGGDSTAPDVPFDTSAFATALGAAGDIAFVGFNADGNDNLAFVAFKDIAAGQVIYFSDNEWNGTGWADTNECTWSWTATSDITAGTIITIDDIGSGTATSNHGDVVIPIAGGGSNRGLGASGEMVYAYLGSASTPTVFLSAVSNNGGSSGSLTNTGLTYGVNAVDLGAVDADADIGAYTGARSGEASLGSYRELINTASNWATQDAGGDQSGDSTDPDVPFSSTPFTTAGALPALAIDSVSIAEGNSGETLLQFTVSLNTAAASTVTVDYATADGSATVAGNDYVATSGTLSFAPGETTKTITVTINGDTTVEANETLSVTLTNPAGAAIATAQGTGTITNDDFSLVAIHDIQGAGLNSPLVGQSVTTSGIVTAVAANGFYLQARDADADADNMTSEAIFVFTSTAPTVVVGDEARVTATVAEYIPGGAGTGNLSTTELTTITSLSVLSHSNALPSATVIGEGGRLAPTESVTEGMAFYESLEGMLVTINNPLVVSGTNEFGEIWTVADNGLDATNLAERDVLVSRGSFGDGLAVTNTGPGSDYNPERIQIDADPAFTPGGTPIVNAGAVLHSITGVVSYNFGNFEVLPTTAVTVATPSLLATETTALVSDSDTLTIAQYNVLNLDPNDTDGDSDVADGRFELIAEQIVNNLQAPDIIALQEIQDNSGAANDHTVSASVTLQMLVDAIAAAGGPTYTWVDNPFIVDNQVGGEPGGNIRVAYLYNAARVDLVPGSVQTTPDAATDFAGSRVPLIATFGFSDQEFTLVNNHFSSKGGSSPLTGETQPSINGSAAERLVQAQAVADYVESLDSDTQVIVLGDLNEFTNEESLAPLFDAGMTAMSLSLDPTERYSYLFEGNAQELDQTFVSLNLLDQARLDIVHANAEFAYAETRASDHDPSVLAITVTESDHTTIGGITIYDPAQSLEGQVPTPEASDDVVLVRLGAIQGASAGAESVAYENGKVYATNVNGNTVNVHSITAAGALVNETPIALSGLPEYKPGGVNSVAIKNGVIAVAYENVTPGEPGHVALFDAATHTLLNLIEVGVLPDQVTFSADGTKLLVANEAEAISLANNPVGTVSIIDMSGGAAAASVSNTISFAALNGSEGALAYQGLALYPGQAASADIEPEYITVSPDGTRAYVTLQEVNAVAVIDLTDASADRPIAIQPLGTVDRSLAGNALDTSDRDGGIDIHTAPVFGLLQPDAIASFTIGGATYFVTANEGDARVGSGIEETDIARLKSVTLDPTAFPDAASLQADEELGRLNILTKLGDTDGDGDYDQIYTLGGRGISIFRQEADGSITKVRETGGEFESIIAATHPELFNSNQSVSPSSVDTRSDDKGPEPEGVTIGEIDGRLYAFVGLERVGGFMVYDVTDPENAVFVTYKPETAEDLGPEVQTFVSAAHSPIGQSLLISGNEIGNSVTFYSVQVQNGEANTLVGAAEDDSFHAKGGDDTITGNGGDDDIDGGEGSDTAAYAGAWSDYDVTDGGATVTDTVGDEGTDTLVSVERLKFGGVTVSASAAVNDAPIGVDDGNTGPALVEDGNSAAEGNVLTNDTDADLALGLGETLTVTGARTGLESAEGTLLVLDEELVLDGVYGTLTIAADGSWSYTLDQGRAATQALNAGQFGVDAFTYQVQDAHGLVDTAQLRLNIQGQDEVVSNRSPLLVKALPDVSSPEDAAIAFALPSGAFTDPDNDSLTYTARLPNGDALPAWLHFNGTTGAFSGTPPLDFNGSLTITVTASDGVASASDSFLLTITPVNDAPMANEDHLSTRVNTAVSVSAAALLANDSDAEGDALALVQVSGATHGTVALRDGTVIFTPDAGFVGSARFTYTVVDGTTSTLGTVTVDILARDNRAPVFDPDTAALSTLSGKSLAFGISATDADGDTLTYTPSDPAHGTLALVNGGLVYTPDAGFTGIDAILVTVSDGHGGSDSFTATIAVLPLGDAAEWRLVTTDGWAGEIGGSGEVYGTAGFQDVTVLDVAGLISFDPSFNGGGDVIRLSGEAADWLVSSEGSNALLFDGDTLLAIPAGAEGLTLVFDDGARTLAIDAQAHAMMLGSQVVNATLTPITAAAEAGTPTDGEITPDAAAQILLGEGGTVIAGGVLDVFGTTDGAETVHLTYGDVTFDPSFNQGGDLLLLDDEPDAIESVQRYGSGAVIESQHYLISLPAGPAGMDIDFAGDRRELIYSPATNQLLLGDQVLVTTPAPLSEFA